MIPDQTNQTWEIILLTPLHVGDGHFLVRDRDYTTTKNRLSVYFIDSIIDSVADNPKAINDLAHLKLEAFMQHHQPDLQPEYTLPVSSNNHQEIRRFLKNAYGEPYLAGSTFKGAIRTALRNTLNHAGLPPASNYRAFSQQVKKLEGQPHDDFIRPLNVSDSPGINPRHSLRVEEVKIFNVQTNNRPGWKDFSKKTTLNRFEDVNGIFVEALKPETSLHIRVELNAFLQKPPVNALWPIPKAKGLSRIENLAGVINDHSRKTAEKERDFFADYGQVCAGALKFYNDLLQNGFKLVETIPGAFLLRMAWSSGWKGMTGDWIKNGDMEPIRKENNLGKNFCPRCRKQIQGPARKGNFFCRSCKSNFASSELELSPIFPKTRRLAMKDGSPSLPMGWVLVKPSQSAFWEKAVRSSYTDKIAETIPMETDTPEHSPADKADIAPQEKPTTVTETLRETWDNVHLVRTPQNNMIIATSGNRKATVTGKELVPDKLHKLLFGKKKSASGQKVDVEAVGNAYKIIKIY